MTKLNYDPILGLVSWEFVNTFDERQSVIELMKPLQLQRNVESHMLQQKAINDILFKQAGVISSGLKKTKVKGRSREERQMWKQIQKITKR